MVFEMPYQPMIEDFTSDGNVSLFAVLKIFENTANKQADFVNDNVFDSCARGKAWILMDWHVEMTEYPHYGDEIKAFTWMQTLNSPIISTRNFLLHKNGGVCGKGSSRWILADVNTGQPTKLGQTVIDTYQPEDTQTFAHSNLPKIEIPEHFLSETIVQIRRNDFDFNNHIHNLVYFDYALEALPKSMYDAYSFSKLWISYKTAINGGNTVTAKYCKPDGRHLVCIFGDDGQFKSFVLLE